MLLTFFSGFGQTYFISLSNPQIREALGLSHGGIGLAYGVATLTSAFILMEFGKIVDRLPTRTAALIVVAGLVAACIILASVQAVWMLVIAFLALRLFGQGMMGHVAMVATGKWYEANRGRAVSLVVLGHALSEAILPILAVSAMALVGWRMSWVLAAAALLLIALPALALLLASERTPTVSASASTGTPSGPVKRSWRRSDVLREPVFCALLVGVLSPPFMMTALFFQQLHLVEIKDWTAAAFAIGFTLFAATAVPVGLATGALIDRFSARALLPVFLLPMALALLLAALLEAVWAIYVFMVLLGGTAGAASTISGALWPEVFGVAHLGEIRAVAMSCMVAASAASPLITGLLIDAGVPFTAQLLWFAAAALLASGLMGLIQPRLADIALDRTLPPAQPFRKSRP